MRVTARLLCGLIVLPRLPLAAQEAPLVAPGERVRVSAPAVASDAIVGTFVARAGDTLVVALPGRETQLALPLTSVQGLEVSRGRHSNALAGLGIGAFFGALFGAISGAGCESDWVCPGPGGGAALGALGLALPGVVIGALTHSERWERIPLARVSVGAATGANGLALGISMRF